jgi:protein-tyrosine phosphatase
MSHSPVSFRRSLFAAVALPVFALCALASGGNGPTAPIAKPPVADSMGPLALSGITIENFGVVDGRIYRGAQPSKDEYAQLAALGVKVVIDLRLDAKKTSRERAEAAGLKYVNIPIDDKGSPSDANSAEFLKLVHEAGNDPVYVHCAGGRHRTGAMVAVYRMSCNNWNLEQAYQEMLDYDFYTAWGHGGFKTYVFDYYTRMLRDPSSVPAVHPPAPAEASVAAGAVSH